MWAYDIEVFPNFFSATFVHIETGTIETFVTMGERDDRDALRTFVNSVNTLVGYNSKYYDDVVLTFVLDNPQASPAVIYNFSSALIHAPETLDKKARHIKPEWVSIDLMKMMAFDKAGVSLKQLAYRLQWHWIQDLPFAYDYHIQPEDVDMVLKYNLNDVEITIALYNTVKPLLDLREAIGETYNVDVMSASKSNIANIIMEDMYATVSGKPISEVQKKRTVRDKVIVKDCIDDRIQFQSKELQALRKTLENLVLYPDEKTGKFKYSQTVKFDGIQYGLGIGGLHSADKAGVFKPEDGFNYIDADVSSYYPNIILSNKLIPAHLDDTFLKVLSTITKDRLAAKKNGEKTKAETLKITINSVFGKLGSDTFWLLDHQAFIGVTINGQLYLLMLVEMLHKAGIHTISANTDGIVAKVHDSQRDAYNAVCAEWMRLTALELEFTEYQLYARMDVNNYIAQTVSGKVKTKNLFVRWSLDKDTFDTTLARACNHPVIAEALYQYFINGVAIRDTILNHENVLDFCLSQKIGRNMTAYYRTLEGDTELQRTNRLYVSKSGGAFMKRSEDGKYTGFLVGNAVRILNQYDWSVPIEDYDIDYDWYIRKAELMIEEMLQLNKPMDMFAGMVF